MTQPTQTERNDSPRKPREFWANEYKSVLAPDLYESRAEADLSASPSRIRCIRLREVVEASA